MHRSGSDPQKIPEPFGKTPDQIFHFLDEVIEATSEYALALKPNLAYFEALGLEGIRLFEKVLKPFLKIFRLLQMLKEEILVHPPKNTLMLSWNNLDVMPLQSALTWAMTA